MAQVVARMTLSIPALDARARLRCRALTAVTCWLDARLPRSGALRTLVQVAIGLLVTLVGAALLFPYPAQRLRYDDIESTRLLDRHGRLIYEQRGSTGVFMQPVGLDDIAESVVLATLSSEDAGFYYHPGVDPIGVGRALWLDLRGGRFAYGGSTLTQQLAKRLDPQPRDLLGKAREAWDALRLELALGKRELLAQYLNRVSYGRLAVGIEAASWRYYGKPASQLSLDEGALLAVLPRAPSYYDPQRHPERALARRAHVLSRMAERGWITRNEADRAAAAPLSFAAPASERRAPHVVDLVTARGLVREGNPAERLTIDLDLQEALERRVRLHLAEVERFGATQAGVVVIENATGDVLAMVGSRRYGEREVAGSVNVTTSLRTPGSTLKPFVYALAIADGAHPSSLVRDVPTHFKGYQPRNPDSVFRGALPLREALGSSLNVPAVRTAAVVGPDRIARLLNDAGLQSVDPGGRYGLSIALGGVSVPLVELASAYATLARGGLAMPYRLLAEPSLPRGYRVLSAETAFLVTDALADPTARRREFGMETPLELPFAVAAKTGTSQGYCDNVTVGYTPEVTVAAWVGNFDGAPMRGLLAMQGAAPLWHEAMLRSMAGRTRRGFARPAGVIRADVCATTGLLADAGCPRRRSEYVAARHLEEGDLIGMLDGYRSAEGAAPRPSGVHIVAPPPDATFVIDPLLPPARQRIALRAETASADGSRLRWFVNGEPVGESAATQPVHWTLEPGRFRLRAEAIGEDVTFDEIEIEVKG